MIPGFYNFYGTVVNMISPNRNNRLKILELGTGTGMLTEMILSSYPKAKIVGIDLTDEMLSQAKEKLKKFKDRLTLMTGNFSTVPFEGKFDAVISSLSIHHLTPDGKKRLYNKIYRSLRKGGVFINADMVKSESEHIQKIYMKNWINYMRDGRVSEESIKRRLQGVKRVDIYDSLEDQSGWLKRAGFKNTDIFWKYWNFIVFGGFK